MQQGQAPTASFLAEQKIWTDQHGYYLCTPAAPYQAAKHGERALHPWAWYLYDSDHDGGSCAVYRCPNCLKVFHTELPD